MELRRAGFTANPHKCHLGLSEAKYLGFQVGRGLIKPQEKTVEAVRSFPRPSTQDSQGAPAYQSSRADRPHLRLINPSTHKQRAHRRKERNLSMRQQTNVLSVPFQTAAHDQPASPRAPHGLTRTWTRLRAPQQARAQTPFTLTNRIHPLGN